MDARKKFGPLPLAHNYRRVYFNVNNAKSQKHMVDDGDRKLEY